MYLNSIIRNDGPIHGQLKIIFIWFYFFVLIQKSNKKNQGRKDYSPFLPGSYAGL